MVENLLKSGEKLSFSQYKTYEEIDEVLRGIFTNNPYYWSDRPLYLDGSGELSNIVKAMILGRVIVYEHTFPFVEPDENNQAEAALYDYCFEISKVRRNPLLPLVYYNAFVYMDKLGLSMAKIDLTSKIMRVQRNKYDSILNVINKNGHRFNLDWFLRHSDNFDDVGKTIKCECGTVEAYRVESGIFYGADGYVIFPFPTKNDSASMYYFEMT